MENRLDKHPYRVYHGIMNKETAPNRRSEMKTIKELKQGEMFTLKEIEFPKESQVYVRGEYDRSSKTYSCTKWNDCNAERFFKGTKTVFTEFTF